MGIMNRRFTLREKILLIALVIILFLGIYFLLVYYPIKKERAELERQQEQIDDDHVYWDALDTLYESMKKDLVNIDKTTEIPVFDGANDVNSEFNSIDEFLGFYFLEVFSKYEINENAYNFRFPENSSSVSDTRGIKSYTVPITFNVKGKKSDTDDSAEENFESAYEITKQIIDDLINVGEDRGEKDENNDGRPDGYVRYRCLMNSLNLSASGGNNLNDDDSEITVNCSITFYERTVD